MTGTGECGAYRAAKLYDRPELYWDYVRDPEGYLVPDAPLNISPRHVFDCAGYALMAFGGSYDVLVGAAVAVYGSPSIAALPFGVAIAAQGFYASYSNTIKFKEECT